MVKVFALTYASYVSIIFLYVSYSGWLMFLESHCYYFLINCFFIYTTKHLKDMDVSN